MGAKDYHRSVIAGPRPVKPDTPHAMSHKAVSEPQEWVIRHGQCAPCGGEVLDVACGGGRHGRWFLERGHAVTAVDRDVSAMADIAAHPRLTLRQADIEDGPWPFSGHRFRAVIVVNYLWRPLLPTLVDSVAPGGVLIIDTFAEGQETLGRPRNPEFLLKAGELLTAVEGELQVHAYEHGLTPKRAGGQSMRQRICARRPG